MRNQLFAIISIIAMLTSASFAEAPNPATQIYQKDKAAIVLINSIVTGTVKYPSFNLVELLGSWSSSTEILEFKDTGEVISQQGQSSYSGTYTVSGDTVTLYYTYPSQISRTYKYSVSGNTLRLTNDATLSYTRGTSSDLVSYVQNLILVKDTGINARSVPEYVETGVSGTGFIITQDGYIITNAHVVLAGENTGQMLYNALANQLQERLYGQISQYYNIPDRDKEQVVQIITKKLLNYISENGQLTDFNINYYVLNGAASPGEDIKTMSWPAVVKTQGTVNEKIGGEITWGRDVAILKVEQSNLQTVTLGDSSGVNIGDRIYIIGYPHGEASPIFDVKSRLEPTITSGIVSAKKTLINGIETIQTDATINPGNSGGPAYNDNGEVIGIATFAERGVGNFLMPINLAKEFMKEINVAAPVQTTPVRTIPVPVQTTSSIPGFEYAWLIVLIIVLIRKIR